MKNVLMVSIVFLLAANAALATDTPCKREGTIAAFRQVLIDKESRLSDMSGFAISEAGVYLNSKSNNNVTLTVNLILTENKLQRPEIVKVVLDDSYDNACTAISATILDGE